jgi:hypothetical protein
VKINTDGACRTRSVVGCGGIIRNREMIFILQKGDNFWTIVSLILSLYSYYLSPSHFIIFAAKEEEKNDCPKKFKLLVLQITSLFEIICMKNLYCFCGRVVGVLEGLKYARRIGYRAVELNIDLSALVQLINAR